MIRAMIFDLDGTLVQTERLKALSYARAAVQMCPYTLDEDEVVAAYTDVVGLPRREVAQGLIERFDLAGSARSHMAEFRVSAPWQAFVQVRLRYYEEILADPEVLRNSQWPHNVALLQESRRAGCRTGLATMSRCQQAQRVLEVLDLGGAFDFVATRDDVERGKPDAEIYQLVGQELEVLPEACLVIEDSPSGVQAALAAGMGCIVVPTPFTRKAIHESALLDKRWIVDDPASLTVVVQEMFAVQSKIQGTGGLTTCREKES